ncbi:MAG: peptidase S8 [Acidimicrobiaceae bacterium]|nr:peptidase S8 [Acidimicrobiaceae bacterium]
MNRLWGAFVSGGVLVLILSGTAFAASASRQAPGTFSASDIARACAAPAPGQASCGALQLLDPAKNWHGSPGKKPGSTSGSSTPSGFYPADLQSAYGLAASSGSYGSGETVAIIDAYNDPNALTDLVTYRNYFNGRAGSVAHTSASAIPRICTTSPASGCVNFTKYNQTGGTSSYPRNNVGWSEEISLDLDMVSAICPNCNIALVEANSASFSDLSQAVNFAKTISRVVAISNSYGASEFSGELAYNTDYSFLQGIAMTASSGDGGYGVEYPAASPYLTAVGGTTLTASVTPTSLTWSQTVWSGAGSGCSAYEPQPAGQGTWNTACPSNRTVADTSADANPNTGVAVYDSFHEPGWMVFGGTSVSSPTIASVYALAAGSEGTLFNPSPAQLYQYSETQTQPGPLYNVTSGSNGSCGTYLCNASSTYSPAGMPAYDGPTGNGTPNGPTSLSAF